MLSSHMPVQPRLTGRIARMSIVSRICGVRWVHSLKSGEMAMEIIMPTPGETITFLHLELKAEPCPEKTETQYRYDHKRMKQGAEWHYDVDRK